MKFKVDENLPIEIAALLRAANHHAVTVSEERLAGEQDPRIFETCLREGRALVTLDLDFADLRVYPPHRSPGIIVLRVRRQVVLHPAGRPAERLPPP